MWGLNPSVMLILIPIVFVGIIAIAAVGSLDEQTRGDRISKFFSIASNAAIFFTVLALLYQVTDSEEQSRRAAYSELLTTYYDINQMQFEHPDAWRIMYPSENQSTMTEDEMIAVTNSYFIMNFFERIYLMYRDGDIDEERWKMWENWIRYSLTTSPLFQREWDESCGLHHVDFVTYVETTYDDGICGGPDDVDAAPSVSPTVESVG